MSSAPSTTSESASGPPVGAVIDLFKVAHDQGYAKAVAEIVEATEGTALSEIADGRTAAEFIKREFGK